MQFPDFRSMYGGGCRPTQPFPVFPCLGQASPSSFPQNLAFKLGEYGQQRCHRPARWCSQVQCLGQRYKAHAEMLQFLKG
jgi:hypothetical protein